jgi:hypothetical protein
MAKIQPLLIPTQGTATDFYLKVLSFSMDAQTCQFYYEFQKEDLTPSGNILVPILSGNLDMNEADFAAWAADNNYCIQWAANKLGVTLV